MVKNSIQVLIVLVFCLLGLISCQKDEILSSEVFEVNVSIMDSSQNHVEHHKYQQLLDDIKNSGVPGISMSVHDPIRGMWLGASGKADLKSNIDLKVGNITRVGSTVKTFTATIILILQEGGKLNLDDRVTDYLTGDEIRDLENADIATIRQLLNHSSGIYNYISDIQFQTASLNDLVKEWTPEELLGYARGQHANFKPGEDVEYSNTNYILLGMIISKIENKPFYKVFEEKIFYPLSLNYTLFAAENPVPDNIIRGYADLYSNLNVIDVTNYSGWDYYTADGGLISNPYDLNVFFTSLVNGEIISSPSLDEMMDWIIPNEEDTEFFPIAHGLGIFKMETEWGEAYFHSGDAIGYYANMVYFPDQETTICWAVNGNYGKIDNFTSTQAAMENIFGVVFD